MMPMSALILKKEFMAYYTTGELLQYSAGKLGKTMVVFSHGNE
jgi:hypothetical protein